MSDTIFSEVLTFLYQPLLTTFLVDSLNLLPATIATLTQYPSLLHEAFLSRKPFSQMKLINKVKL